MGTKRYEVSIAKEKEPNCFVLFYCTETFKDAETKCIDTACNEGRECIVYDNKDWATPICFRHKPLEDKDVQQNPATKPTAAAKPDAAAPKPRPKPKPKSKYTR